MRRAIVILLLTCSPVYAQLHGGDVELTVVDNQIMTDARVYSAELGDTGIPNEIDEPGYDNLPGTFPVGSTIGFSILDSLRWWDGSDFNTISAERMSLRFGTSLGPITTPTTPGIVDGFDLNVASDGAWHRHYDYVLHSPASTGVYLLQLQLDSSDAGIAPTDPFFIVFNQDESLATFNAAIDYMESLSAPPLLGDMNGDAAVTSADAPLLIQALVDRPAYSLAYPLIDADVVGDINEDGTFDLGDLAPFSGLFGGASSTAVPEPSAMLLALMAIASLPGLRNRLSRDDLAASRLRK